MIDGYADSHGAVKVGYRNNECIVITIPVTGWYSIAGENKEIYLEAETQFILNGPNSKSDPINLQIR